MAKTKEKTRAEKQIENLKSIYLPPEVKAEVKKYAAANSMSDSEAMRDLMDRFVEGGTAPLRVSVRERITFWVDPVRFARFGRAVRERRTTQAQAIAAMLEEVR